MGRVFQAFKRAERAPLEPRADFDLPRDTAVASSAAPAGRVVGFNRPQRAAAKHDEIENGRVQHLANAEMLARLTQPDDEENYIDTPAEQRRVITHRQ